MRTAADWDKWETLTEAHLKRKGCWAAVKPDSERKVGEATATDDQLEKAFGIITDSIDHDLLECVRDPKTGIAHPPQKLMKVLKDRFFLKSGTNLIALRTELWSLTLAEGESVATLVDQINRLVTNLKAQGGEVPDDDKTCILLKALPPSFRFLRAQLDVKLADGGTITYDSAQKAARLFETSTVRVEAESDRLNGIPGMLHGKAAETALMAEARMRRGAHARDGFKGRCNSCGEPGHRARDCDTDTDSNQQREDSDQQSRGTGKSGAECYSCGGRGHFKSECPTWLKKQGQSGKEQVGQAAFVYIGA